MRRFLALAAAFLVGFLAGFIFLDTWINSGDRGYAPMNREVMGR